MGLLGKNIRYIRETKGLSQMELAEMLDSRYNNISNWENGKNKPHIDIIVKLSEIFQLDLNSLVTKDLREGYSNSSSIEEPPASYGNATNILVPISAQAGYLNEWPQIQKQSDFEYVDVPGVDFEARTFEVEGDSMAPYIYSGEYVVCKKVEKEDRILEGSIYVIVSTTTGITIKFIKKENDLLALIPANTSLFSKNTIPLSEVKEIWRVMYKITNNIYPSFPTNIWDIIMNNVTLVQNTKNKD